jgi:hypothetical protein
MFSKQCTPFGFDLVFVIKTCGVFEGLRVFENRVLRRIFGPKRDELTGGGGGENYIMRS